MKYFMVVMLMLFLPACAEGNGFPRMAAPQWPAGTIETSAGVFQVPAGVDNTGCQQYQTKIPGAKTPQVIKYRKRDGTFTMRRAEADCSTG